MRNIRTLILDAVKFVVLLLLGTICTVFSIACLPSLGLGIALASLVLEPATTAAAFGDEP